MLLLESCVAPRYVLAIHTRGAAGMVSGVRNGHAMRMSLSICAGFAAASLLGSCSTPASTAQPSPALYQRSGDICAETMGLDVTSRYFGSCRNYIGQNGREPLPDFNSVSATPTTHRACAQAGLKDGTPEFDKCVQAMDQIDASHAHL